MARYGKVVDGALVLAPKVLRDGSAVVFSPSAAQYLSAGWFPVDDSVPAAPDGKVVSSLSWAQDASHVYRVAGYADAPAEEKVDVTTLSGMRSALKAIASKVGIATALLAACVNCRAATFTSERLEDMDLDTAKVVTKVDFTGLAASNDLAAVASSVSTMWWQVYGDTVWMAVTNYMRTTSAKPSMGLWEARDGATNCVWSSAEEIAAATDAVRVELTNSVAAARETADAAKSWGRWQSADGSAAVSNYTMVSTPYLMLTGGGKWEQRTVEGGSFWLFSGAGSVGGTEDGGLRLRNADGDVVFEVTKGTMQEVAAVPESFVVDGRDYAPNGTWPITFTVKASAQPTLYAATELSGQWEQWKSNTYTVYWMDNGDGTWTAKWTEQAPGEYHFFRAVYETGSESIVDFKKALKVDKVVVGDTTYTVSVGTMSDGTKFLKLE